MKDKLIVIGLAIGIIIELCCIAVSIYLIHTKEATFISGLNIIVTTLSTVWFVKKIKDI